MGDLKRDPGLENSPYIRIFVGSARTCIPSAVGLADPPSWSKLWLRHNAAFTENSSNNIAKIRPENTLLQS